MTKRILKSIIAVSLTAVIVTIAIIMGYLNSYFSTRVEQELRNEADIIASAVELNGAEYFENSDFDDMRVTWIDPEGDVLYDSDANASQMENHSSREEFKDAIANGSGRASRYSETLMRKTIYYAERLSDGTVVRVSSAHLSIWAQIIEMLQTIFLIFLAVIIFAVLLASGMSKRIVQPINKIDLNNPDIDESYDELSPLLQRIRAQNQKINNQMEQLKRSREQFSLITENMSEGIIIADKNTMILSYNPSALRLLDADTPAERQSVYALNRTDAFRDCIQEALRGVHSECCLETENGSYQIIANPAVIGGAMSGIVIFILDVTEKQQLESMRREFTSNVSHELKTPLTTVYGISDMLANGIVKAEDVPQFGKNIRSESERLIALINDIMALSKLDENTLVEDDEDIDLYEKAAEVIGRLKDYAGEKNVTMTLSGDHVIFHGSATIIDEIIYNLCDNAVKYNNEGGSVTVSVTESSGNAVITVEDTGIGIAPQHIDRIFERFYRVDKSHSRKIKGTGLGLSIVKHGVRYHRGVINVESAPGKGTKFTVIMPFDR